MTPNSSVYLRVFVVNRSFMMTQNEFNECITAMKQTLMIFFSTLLNLKNTCLSTETAVT